MFKLAAGALMSVTVFVVAGAAQAGTYGERQASQGKYVREAPVKDCTKINGRYGFYGNPFCTPQEQARFDRWQARQLRR